MSDLLNCPFCGTTASTTSVRLSEGVIEHFVGCSDQKCVGAPLLGDIELPRAISAWNTRADAARLAEVERDLAAARAEVAAMRERVKQLGEAGTLLATKVRRFMGWNVGTSTYTEAYCRDQVWSAVKWWESAVTPPALTPGRIGEVETNDYNPWYDNDGMTYIIQHCWPRKESK